MVFERDGYAVRTAHSCASALKLLENGNEFDAVITDLNMERENIGLEVARAALRFDRPNQQRFSAPDTPALTTPRQPCR